MLCIVGDNMLTALSVARDCGIIEHKDRVVVAYARPPVGDQPASIEWMPSEETQMTHDGTADILKVHFFESYSYMPLIQKELCFKFI